LQPGLGPRISWKRSQHSPRTIAKFGGKKTGKEGKEGEEKERERKGSKGEKEGLCNLAERLFPGTGKGWRPVNEVSSILHALPDNHICHI